MQIWENFDMYIHCFQVYNNIERFFLLKKFPKLSFIFLQFHYLYSCWLVKRRNMVFNLLNKCLYKAASKRYYSPLWFTTVSRTLNGVYFTCKPILITEDEITQEQDSLQQNNEPLLLLLLIEKHPHPKKASVSEEAC